jgi:hypothetical protein
MERVSQDVLTGAILPFLQMRDLRSLRTVSKRTHACLSKRLDRCFDTRPYVCAYDGCSNREFLYKTVDPFIAYVETAILSRTIHLLANFVSSMCLFPLYSIPFYRIIYILVRVELGAPDLSALADAFGSYLSVGNWICALTNSQPMKFCTCTDSMGSHAAHRAAECTHAGWCLRTQEGGCIQCLFVTTRVKSEMSTLPYSFYVYVVMYLLLPGIGLVLMLPLLILFSLLCIVFGIPIIVVIVLVL